MSQPGHNGPPPDKPGPYAIYRFAKITSLPELVAAVNHMLRAVPTPNADTARRHLNRILRGSDDPMRDIMALIPSIGQRDADGLLLRRTNSVLAVELLLTASPEWWAEATPADRQAWQEATLGWIERTWGASNIAHLQWHLDETTPHVTGFVVPRDGRGALNCRSFIGEKQQVRDQQTSYAQAVEHLGLKRGIEGSKAIHQAVKRYYGAVNAAAADLDEIKVPTPSRAEVVISPEAWAKTATERMVKQLEPTVARAKAADLERTGRKGAETTARAQSAALEAAKAERQALAARMREMDLHAVCDALALSWDAKDKVWRGETVKIAIGDGPKAGKWFDFLADKGRGGAIDLAQHVLGTDFNGAIAFLAHRFGSGAAAADAAAKAYRDVSRAEQTAVVQREPFKLPDPDPDNWPVVRNHLVKRRRLPGSYLDRLHSTGDLYADARRNAVFVCRDADGKPVGAELKGTVERPDGTRFSGLAPGSLKDGGGFRIGSILKAKTIYLVESAIDAISLMRLRWEAGEKNIAIISTAGVSPEPRKWLDGISRSVRRICAFDADDVGDKAAHKLRRHGFERLRPGTGKDWNDVLRQRLEDDERSGDTSRSAGKEAPRSEGPEDSFRP